MSANRSGRAFSYVRFSTPEQSKGDSYKRQTEGARAWASKAGLRLDETLRLEDLGISAFRGANATSGALAAFHVAIAGGRVPRGSVLIVENLDRLSRQTARKAVRALEDIVEAGVDVVTLSDGKRYDRASLDGFDFLMAVMVLIRGHEESKTKAARNAAAWRTKRTTARPGYATEVPRRADLVAWTAYLDELEKEQL